LCYLQAILVLPLRFLGDYGYREVEALWGVEGASSTWGYETWEVLEVAALLSNPLAG
jgi:hypothetical protein